ncbi:MAG TPA: cytochrome-c oxidase, cbb3-type subunit III [Reyranella sp.]|nr:cytochrome-c oxidase, cbb3-type subunit III [Reyranella sp.]
MAVEERDPHSGYLTTGHEWNGIKELNTPVPRLVYICLFVTALFSLGYWILMPAFPLGSTYTKGLLGSDDRAVVAASVKQATADRSVWADQITQKSYADIQADPRLMTQVRATGSVLFGDNCASCHGREAKGGRGFPNLTTNSWLWGGTPEAIAETIQVGINAPHPKTRISQMPAFGRDSMLKRDEMENVVAYVMSLSKSGAGKAAADKVAAGKAVFAANCMACHGPEAKGNPEVGAPSLIDHYWMHGSDESALYADVWGGLQGHMPSWEGRLSALDRRILALYIVDLRRPKP